MSAWCRLRALYIRRTKTRSTTHGESYYTHRLVRSERVGARVRQHTLLNLGRHFEVAQEHWPQLCARLDQLLSTQPALLPVELADSVEQKAQEILARLVASESHLSTPSGQVPGTAKTDIQSVDVNSLELLRPRSVGVEHVGLWAMQQLRLEALLGDLGLNGPQRAAALGLIIARMAAPGAELATHRWLRQSSALGELIDLDYTRMSLMQLYRTSDRLIRHRERIEKVLFNRTVDLFGLDCTITLYDLTNTYFEGDPASNPKARRGHSKEKRSDCPLLTLDGSGFVWRSEIFAGNIFEGKTLQSMLKHYRPQRVRWWSWTGGLQPKKTSVGCSRRGIVTWS